MIVPEVLLNARRTTLGKDTVDLTRFAGPLREVVPPGVQTLPLVPGDDGRSLTDAASTSTDLDDDHCDSAWCAT